MREGSGVEWSKVLKLVDDDTSAGLPDLFTDEIRSEFKVRSPHLGSVPE
jgi:hypothetical protein